MRDKIRAESGIDGTARSIRRPVGLPSGRAVVGGLLVTASVLGVFVFGQRDAGADRRSAVVAAADLPIGHVLAAADLATVAASGDAGAGYSLTSELVGARTLAPLDAGDLIQASSVLTADEAAPSNGALGPGGAADQVSFPIPIERAANGRLELGERIHLLATATTRGTACTGVVAADATVLDLDVRDDLGGADTVVLTVALSSPEEVLATTHASQVADLTVVRALGSSSEVGLRHCDGAGPAPAPEEAPEPASAAAPADEGVDGAAGVGG